MMIRRGVFSVLLMVATSLAMAQVAKPFIGTWKTEWETDKQTYEAEMVVTETGGTWKTQTSRRNNPCFGREVPLQHDAATERSLSMTLKFSDVITGCRNVSVKLDLDGAGAVIGKRSNYDLKLTRTSN